MIKARRGRRMRSDGDGVHSLIQGIIACAKIRDRVMSRFWRRDGIRRKGVIRLQLFLYVRPVCRDACYHSAPCGRRMIGVIRPLSFVGSWSVMNLGAIARGRSSMKATRKGFGVCSRLSPSEPVRRLIACAIAGWKST